MNGVLESLRAFQLAQIAAFRRASEALGVSETDLSAMRALLARHELGVSMKDLASEIGVSPAVLTGVVDRLVDKAWVSRRASSEDRRSFVVTPIVPDDADVVRLLAAIDDPIRRLAESMPAGSAAVVERLAADMEAQLRAFDPAATLQR